jgi:ABC-type dipeptide/oligopeptide/nickel transport system permease component
MPAYRRHVESLTRFLLGRPVATVGLATVMAAASAWLLLGLGTELLPRNVSQEQKDALRERLGLDLPLAPGIVRTPTGFELAPETLPDSILENQFVASFGNLFRLDFGDSFAESRPVIDVIADAFWPTVLLIGTATTSSARAIAQAPAMNQRPSGAVRIKRSRPAHGQ